MFVGLSGVSDLSIGDGLSELRVEFVQVDGKFASTSGGEVVFGVDGDVRMIALVGEERRDTGGRVRSVVVGELREWEKTGPVVLLVVAVDAEILLQGLVDAFSLSISLRMVTGGEVESHVEDGPQ